ncbi:zinc-dependent metalloprotease [Vibrio vulnificus]|nr:zinc-dependent metalloprotease [Vibrio vulnificus]EKO5189722.1 zinc-dependent metalloprotease [Vibrio vulnificus]ELO5514373.1 zinc-dependent metalloprotease [Vibrio vulnificus]
MVSVALYGCGAEERAYEYQPRAEEQITKSSLDTEALWLYMPSTGAAPRYAATQRGFFQGTPKLVTLRFDKANGIIAEEVDRDTIINGKPSRYDSSINLAPVLKIPGEFQQYRCAEDQFDECTNKEELNTDASLSWQDTTHFTPDYAGIKSLAVDTVDAWWTADNVTETAEPRLVHWEYDAAAGVINVEVERTFTASADDMYQFGSQLEDLSFKTRFFYSLVKLDKLASPDYEVVHYPGKDSQRYGFFNDEKTPLSVNGEANLQGEKFRLINRFNPKKESVDYYLSDSYFSPEGKEFLQTTLDTIEHINQILAGTGVPKINIVNKDKPAGKHPGDLRINMFNLITDPVDNGLLGYGPSATNPLTGEIVHAHVNQYAGVIRASAREMWRRLAVHYNRQEIARPAEFKLDETDPAVNNGTDDSDAGTTSMIFGAERVSDFIVDKNITNIQTSLPLVAASEPDFNDGVVTWLRPDMQSEYSFNKQALSYAKQRQAYAEQNMYSDQFLWVSTQSKGLIKGIDYKAGGYFDNAHLDPSAPDYADKVNTKLKAWEDLNADQQAQVTKQISQHIYTSTLVHELGHNLGLRHNFMGSMDKSNFYSEQEITALGYDKVPAYSSIMDYGASIFDELPTYGKYDIAALRFGYQRQAEVKTLDDKGETTVAYVSLSEIDEKVRQNYRAYPLGTLEVLKEQLKKQDDSQPTQSVKNYYYCSDENTSSTTTCNRFDEGTNILELTEFRIQQYWDSYEFLNKRNGRNQFYEYQVHNYTVARLNQFNEIRKVIEDLGEIDYYFAQLKGEEEESYGQNVANFYTDNCQYKFRRSQLPQGAQMICDTFDAALLAADFFVKVMAQPDHVCEIEVANDDQPLYRFVSLNDLWTQYGPRIDYKTTLPESCFDADLVAELAKGSQPIKVLAETRDGRPYADMKANNPHQSSSSAIDLMGIWPDKLLAAQMLVKRNDWNSVRAKSNMALMDVSDVRSGTKGTPRKMKEYLSFLGFADDKFRSPVFVDQTGEYVETKSRYVPDLRSSIEVPPYLYGIKSYFQLSQSTVTPYFNALLTNLVAFGQAEEYGLSDSSQHLIDDITLTKPSLSVDLKGGYEFTWKTRKYMVTRRNGLAKEIAKKAMFIDGRETHLELLNNLPNPVNTYLNFAKLGIRSQKDATLYLLRDSKTVELLNDASSFNSLFNPFSPKFVHDKANNCYYPKGQDAADGCHNQNDLLVAWQAIDANKESAPEYLENLLAFSAQAEKDIKEQVTDNPDYAQYYAIPVESIWLWNSGEYRRYRRSIEQLPIME